MSLAYPIDVRAIAVLRAGVVARDLCRRGQRGEVAAVFERSFYLRIGDDFICIGKPSIGNGPTTLIVAACVAALDVRQGQRAFISRARIAIGDLLFDLAACETWRAPPWPAVPSPAALRGTCADLAHRAAAESPAGSLARAAFAAADTPLTRLARPRVAKFAAWLSERISASSSSAKADDPVNTDTSVKLRGQCLLDAPLSRGMTSDDAVSDLIGLGPGLTPSGDDFLVGALAALDALGQTNIRAVLGRAVVAAADRTSPLSASLLRAAAAGHVSENLHTMVAALVTSDADAAIAAAARFGHTSGFDALAGAVVTLSGDPSRTMLDDGSLRLGANPPYDYRC
jgi:Protein of unknown function (DUF2877)